LLSRFAPNTGPFQIGKVFPLCNALAVQRGINSLSAQPQQWLLTFIAESFLQSACQDSPRRAKPFVDCYP